MGFFSTSTVRQDPTNTTTILSNKNTAKASSPWLRAFSWRPIDHGSGPGHRNWNNSASVTQGAASTWRKTGKGQPIDQGSSAGCDFLGMLWSWNESTFKRSKEKSRFPGAMALLQLLQLHVPLQLLAVPREFQRFYTMDIWHFVGWGFLENSQDPHQNADLGWSWCCMNSSWSGRLRVTCIKDPTMSGPESNKFPNSHGVLVRPESTLARAFGRGCPIVFYGPAHHRKNMACSVSRLEKSSQLPLIRS